ncbi:MAG: hypothetical protein JXA57_08120 [Armatimonadetes bacterium]|nr:hypothetical protein [Armatimonadota bacterium]
MTETAYVKVRQRQWALRHNKSCPRGYMPEVKGNLFEPLINDALEEYRKGGGGELQLKMRAVHSSSALVCNVFHYWRRLGRFDTIAKACKVPSGKISGMRFEYKCRVHPSLKRVQPPNVDVVFLHGRPSKLTYISAVESKFTEPYGRQHKGLSRTYLSLPIWEGLDNLRALAKSVSPDDKRFRHLHVAQLVAHVLGLRARHPRVPMRLVYLWYDAPGAAGALHREEIETFSEVAAGDGVRFQHRTYQDVLAWLASHCRDEHRGYVDYVTERYL